MDKIRGFEVVSKYHEEAQLLQYPKRATKFSAGYDIFNNTGADIVMEPGEISLAITTKFKSYMQPDEYLALFVRSGHGFKFSVRLANSTGIVDSDYYNNEKNEGEIFIKLHNQGHQTLVIKKGEAMAQAIFTKYLIADGDLSDSERTGGLGSTSLS